jgi:hypothetical protein
MIGQEISGRHQRGSKWIKEMPTWDPFGVIKLSERGGP